MALRIVNKATRCLQPKSPCASRDASPSPIPQAIALFMEYKLMEA